MTDLEPVNLQPTNLEPAGKLCLYCNMIDCTMPGHQNEVVETAVTQVPDPPPMMRHPGIPLPMAISAVVAIIVLSHVWLWRRHRAVDPTRPYARLDLLSMGWIKSLVHRPFFPLLIQFISILLFVLIVVSGLFGSQRAYPAFNIAPVLTWNIWWSLLIFFILFGGTIFCAVCPWEGIASLVTSLSL